MKPLSVLLSLCLLSSAVVAVCTLGSTKAEQYKVSFETIIDI